MRFPHPFGWAGIWVAALAWTLAPVCAHAEKQTAKEANAALSAPAKAASAQKKSPARAKKKAGKTKAKAKKKTAPDTPHHPLKLNPKHVLTLQMQALNAQYEGEDFSPRHNRFTRWVDDVHARTYRWMDNAVRRVDMSWLADDVPYDPETSMFRLKLLGRYGGRSSEPDSEFKVRFRADVALPGLEHRLHLFVDNADRESLPGTDPMKQNDDTRIGIRAALRTLKNSELSMGGGLRWRHSQPVAYVSLDWKWERDMGAGRFCLNPHAVCYTDDGFGQTIAMRWTRALGARTYFQTQTAERSSESREDVELEQSLRFAWLRSGKGRGWVAQASIFPHIRSSDWYWDDSLVNLTWRDAFYRRWIYYTITPQVQFPKEDEYEARPSIRFGLEMYFGGKSSDLL